MPTEVTIYGYECGSCHERFMDYNDCDNHERECEWTRNSMPEYALCGIKDGQIWIYTTAYSLYIQNGDVLECAGARGVGVPVEFDFLFSKSFDRNKKVWHEDDPDDIPF